MKRLIYSIFIIFILFIFSPISVFASSDSDNEDRKIDISGYDNWTTAEKRSFWSTEILTLIGASADLVLNTNASGFKSTVEDVYRDMAFASNYDSYADFLASKVTTNSSGEFVYDESVLDFFNACLDRFKEDTSYQYGFFPTNVYLSVDSFSTKGAYDIATTLIAKYPDKVFRFNSSSIPGMADIKGNEGGKPWDWCSGWKITVYDVPYGAVGSPINISSSTPTSASCYTEEWQLEFSNAFEVYLVDWAGYGFLCFWDKEGNYHEILDYKSIEAGCIDDAYAYLTSGSHISTKLNSTLAFSTAYFSKCDTVPMNLYCFSNYSGGIPVFNSLADLKKGTEGKSPLQTLPGYTGQPITKNTISQKEINDYSTNYNYYYGNGSGNDPGGSGSGSGSGSGGWIDSIVSGLGSFFDGILTIVGKVIELIGKLISLITDAFADLLDIVPTNFVNFLTALFPMVPEEWITAATLFITLALLGVLIRLFTK